MVYGSDMVRPPISQGLIACFVLFMGAACNGPCDERSLEKCEEDPGCSLISGQALDEDKMCKSPYRAVGCGDADRICGAAFTYAKDREQVAWEFNDTCIPEGWEPIDSVSSVDWEICEP